MSLRGVAALDGEAPREIVELAREMVRLEPDLSDEDRTVIAGVVVEALAALESGSTRMPVRDVRIRSALLRAPALVSKDPNAYTPLIFDGEHLYLQRMLLLERRFAETFARKVSVAIPVDRAAVRAGLQEVKAHPLPLSPEQEAAVERAAIEGFTVISGGPGTGKTSIIVSLLRVLVRSGVEAEQIALAAPTGKAANRMDEAIRRSLDQIEEKDASDAELAARCPKAQTIHRLLGYSPKDGSFRHHEENQLAQRVVIVDESSMIDLVLMEQLLRSVRPDARLVLLGDAEQLPSVEAGAVLRDIRTAERPRGRFTVTLEKSFRMNEADPGGRAIVRAARAINAGDPEAVLAELRVVERADDLRFSGVELLETSGFGLHAFLDRFHRERIAAHREWIRLTRHHYRFADGAFAGEDQADLETLFAHHARFKLLAVTRESAFTGAASLNESIHRMVLHELKVPATPLLPGEPVMMLKNDYERGLFNGDQGAILSVISEGRPHPMAVFRTAAGFEPFHLMALKKDLALAHAMTVHKSQGSEFDQIALVLPDVELPILTRELIYTAVTRARRAVTIVGARAPLFAAITRRVERHSGLAERISVTQDH
jgi:exodeoxyribonuclease V alpha subunit